MPVKPLGLHAEDAHPVPHARPVLRWIKRIVLGLLALVVVVIGGALIALHTDWGREQVRAIVAAQLDKTFTGGATIGKLEGSPFGELVVRDLAIHGPDGKPAITARALHLELALLPLLSGEVRVDRVVGEDVDVRVARNPDGTLQFGQLLRPGPPSTWTVLLRDVEIHGGHVAVDTGAADPADRALDVDAITLDAAATLPHLGTTRAALVVHGVWRQRALPIDLALSLTNDAEVLTAPGLLVSAGALELAAADVHLAKGEGLVLSGIVAARAPAAELARVLPGVALPDDVAAAAIVTPAPAGALHASLFGLLGATPLRAFVTGDVAARTARGVLITGDLDAGKLTRGRVAATGGAVVAFDAALAPAPGELPAARAMVTAWGALAGQPRIEVAAALTSGGERVRAVVGATTPGALVGFGASVLRHGEALTLEDGRLVAGARDPARITPASPAVYGSLHANLAAHGPLSPSPDLTIVGALDGEHLKLADLTIASLQFSIDAHSLPAQPLGSARLVIAGLDKGTQLSLETLTVAAANRPDRTIQVSVRTRPRVQPWLVDADAIVTPGPTTTIDLTRHHVRAAAVDWTGTTGRIAIGPRELSVTGLRTASAKGSFGLDLRYDHAATSGHLALTAEGEVARVGSGKLVLDLDTPPQLGDLTAWLRLPRAAIRKVELTAQADVAQAGLLSGRPGYAGTFAAKLAIAPADLQGTFDLKGLALPTLVDVGPITAHLELAQRGRGELTAQATGQVAGVGGVHLRAAAELPDRPLDVAAWRVLGRAAFHGAQVQLDEIALDTALLDQLHLNNELRGKVDFAIAIPAGARSATMTAAIHQLHGGPIARPIELQLESQIDDRATRAGFHARTKQGELLGLDANLPLTLAALLADPAGALAAPLALTITLPTVSAPDLLATFGRNDVTKGTLGGTVTVAGTLGKPTLTAKLEAKDIEVPPGVGSTQTQVMRRLALDATWDGTTGELQILGDEANGGTLAIQAVGSPRDLAAATASLEAKKFDLRALTAFAPGLVGSIAGQVDGKIDAKGLDPRTMDLTGQLTVAAARVPIAPNIGTLWQASLHIAIANRVIQVDATGKLGHEGTVKLVAEAPLEQGAPTGGKATLTLRKISPIGAIQPVIDSDITATITRADDTWQAKVQVAHTLVKVPDDKGTPLDPVGPPTDLVYGKRRPPQQAKSDATQKAPPPHPILVAQVDLGDVIVESSDARGVVRGKLEISLGQAPVGGSPVGIIGDVTAQRGELSLFDRRYQLDHGALHFDGSPDPQLDIRISYDFPDVTTITEVHGRLSKPELQLSSSPGIYSQGELLGFLLGGEPNGDVQQSQSAAARVSGAGTSLLANQVGGYVRKALPVSIDVLKYEAASTANSAAITVGTWLTHTLFLAYRQHLAARPDENSGEGDLEYYIKPRLILQGTAGDRGVDGVDLLWRRRW